MKHAGTIWKQRWIAGALLSCGLAFGAHAAELALNVTGGDSDLRATLRGGSLLAEQTTEGATPSPQELVAAAQADYARLLAVLYDQGYFGPEIKIALDGREASAIPPVSPPRQINRAVITIDTGPQFRFGRISIAPVAPGTELPDGFSEGETASLGMLKETVSSGISGWRAEGHAKAELASQDLTARHTDRTITADLRLAPGPKLRFGQLVIKGNADVRTNRIVDIAGLPVGEVFSPDELRLVATRLRRTETFSSVAVIEADQPAPDGTLPITVQVSEAPKRRFGFGGELSTQEGLTLSSFWLHRNFLGGAERLRVEGEVRGIGGQSGGTDYTFGVRFDRPATFNEDTNFFALAELEQLDEVNFFSRQINLEAGIERIANENRTYTAAIGLRTAETRDVFGTTDFTLLTFPLGVTFDYRDDKLDATSGYYASASLTPFLAINGADDGARSYIDARYYHTVGTKRPVTFALRGQLGSVFGSTQSAAPADFLFYSGGGGTVRGQPFQSLGVDIGNDQTAGGRSFLGISTEARIKVTDSIGIVGFVDAGYVGEEQFFDGTGVWQSGAGLGLRYNTAIGPIRLDVGVPTSGPDTGEDFQIYIGIGQAF